MEALKSIDQLNINAFKQEFSEDRINSFLFDLTDFPFTDTVINMFGPTFTNLSVLDYTLIKLETNRLDTVLTLKLQELLAYIVKVCFDFKHLTS